MNKISSSACFEEKVRANIANIMAHQIRNGLSRPVSQSELARMTGMSQQQISRLLISGNPTLHMLWTLSEALRVDPVLFLQDTERDKLNDPSST